MRQTETLDRDLTAWAFECSADCIKMLSADGRLLVLNAGGAAAMGFGDPEEPVGRNWIDFWQGDEREAARAAVARAAAGEPATMRGSLPTASGRPCCWDNRLVPLPGLPGEAPRLLVISTDVTARLDAERARARFQTLYETLVQATTQIVWTSDAETSLCDFRGWAGFTGSAAEARDREAWRAAVHPDDRDRAERAIALAQRDGQRSRVDYRLQSQAGGWRWVEDHAVPMTDPEGAQTGWVGVITDIDDRKRAEQTVRDEGTRLRLALDSASLGTWEVALATGECRMSPEARRMFGLAETEAVSTLLDVFHPEDRDAVVASYREGLSRDTGTTLTTFRIVRPDTGDVRWIASRGRAVLDGDGRPVHRVGTVEDFTDRKRTEDVLESTLRRHRALLDATSVIVWHSDAAQEIVERQGWATFTGQGDAGGGQWLDAVHPADRRRVTAVCERARAAGEPYRNELRLAHAGGGYRWVRDAVVPLRAADGAVEGWVGIISDIHERRSAEEALLASERRLRLASEVAGLGTYEVDLASGERVWSPEFCALLRLPRAVVPERRLFFDRVHPDDHAQFLEDWYRSETTDCGLRVSTFRLRFEGDEVRWIEARERLFPDEEGRGGRRIGTMQDVTDRKRVEQELWRAAHADSLTELANRTLFQARVEEAVTRADLFGTEAGVLIVDVDRFKDINDTLGHDAGDTVLRTIAERLRRHSPADATVARLGGDEFGVVIPCDPRFADVGRIGDAILHALRQPLMHEGREIECSGSIGWSAYPRHDADASALLKNADVALYAAKKAGRNRAVAFDATMREDLSRRVHVLRAAKESLARDAVFPFYQPKISLQTGRVVGFEALLRWSDASGLRSPADLQEAFVDPDLACRLGARMLRSVVADMRAWTERDVPFGHVALNAGAPELHRPDYAEGILAALDQAGLRTDQLEIEVTEGVLLDDATVMIANALKRLDGAGVSVALDDFGTGYASLTHLKRFPVTWLKIDRSFVSSMERDDDARAIVRAVVGLAHSLGLRAVAEGVETRSQRDGLAAIGCDVGQGYLAARPMAAAEVPGFLAGWQAATWRGAGRDATPHGGSARPDLLDVGVELPPAPRLRQAAGRPSA